MKEAFVVTKERFNGFSDAVFAIAVTLLVLKFQLPAMPEHPTLAQQIGGVIAIWPQYLVYVAGFLTIGIVWMNHNAMFRHVERISHGMAVANLLLLLFVALLPLPTEVMARFGLTRVTVVGYGLLLSAIAFSALLLNREIFRAEGIPPLKGMSARLRRIALYPVATVLGYFFPIWGLAMIALLAVVALLPQSLTEVTLRPHDKGEPPNVS